MLARASAPFACPIGGKTAKLFLIHARQRTTIVTRFVGSEIIW
jgi:hypothetical protein